MTISKQDYIYRSLKKVSHKGWETFVISRILHGLDDDEIEFVTQQLVVRPNGERALTDIYFPQFSLHVEVDEGYHEAARQLNVDERRAQDIVQITGHEIKRIKIADGNGAVRSLADVRRQVDSLVDAIKRLKKDAVTKNAFTPWDLNTRYLSAPVIERGYVDIRDNVVFQVQVEALKCFGFKGKVCRRGGWVIPDGSKDVVWFPRLYRHGLWHNQLVNGGKTILEQAIDEDGIRSIEKQRRDEQKHPGRKHIVFAKAKDPLGYSLLRYVGTFRVALEKSTHDCLVFDQVSTKEPIRVLE